MLGLVGVITMFVGTVLAGALAPALPADSHAPLVEQVIVIFDDPADPDFLARDLCLLYGCQVRHVYRLLPGMAVSGGRLRALRRAPGVVRVEPDHPVRFSKDGVRLFGAPEQRPLAIVGADLSTTHFDVEHRWSLQGDAAGGPLAGHADAAELLEEGLQQSGRRFWTLPVLNAAGEGRLSDLLAALEHLVAFRFVLGAIFIPLELEGSFSPQLCRMIDDVLRRGLLVVTAVDAACPLASGIP